MKRIAPLSLALVLILTFTACNQNSTGNTSPESAAAQEIHWDLSDIYPDQAAFEAEFGSALAEIDALAGMRGTLNTVENVAAYYADCDTLTAQLNRLSSYAMLQVQKNQSNSAAKELSGRVDNLSMQLANDTAFALPELFANDDAFLDAVAANTAMKPYLYWFSSNCTQQAHQLSETEEQLLLPTYRLQAGAYYLFDSLTGSDMVFPEIKFPDGTKRPANETNYGVALEGGYTQAFRLEFSNTMLGTYGQYRNTFAQNLQNYYTAATEIAVAYNYTSALEAELAPGGTPMLVYTGVLDGAEQAQPTVERYLALCRKSLGLEKLYSFDVNVPIAQNPGTVYPYEDAKKLINEALAPLGADYRTQLNEMLSNASIDVYPAKNKSSGAFALSVPDVHPYVLLNYADNFDSVSTTAHELGHAVHMLYSQTQESSNAANVTSLTSEVASTLNELLLSDYMIQNAKTDEERQYYAAQQMTTLYSTFFTQAFFARFQESVAEELENGGTLTADKLDKLWIGATQECFGEAYSATDTYAAGWSRIPHFYNGFYVYQYAVGIASACNIADRIQSGDPNAVKDYLLYLKAGNSAGAADLLKIAGVDITTKEYIGALTTRFDRLMTQFEKADRK